MHSIKKSFRPAITTMLMIGDMSPEQMKDLAHTFRKWTNPSDQLTIAPTPAVKEISKKLIKVFPEKDYTQCSINIRILLLLIISIPMKLK